MDKNIKKRTEMNRSGQKWADTDNNGPKLTKIDRN